MHSTPTGHTPATPPAATGAQLLNALHWRYATKAFDANKRLTPEQWSTLEQALVLTPSSYGLQPWRFINVTDKALREQLKPASWGQSQITDASHLVVFAAKSKIETQDVEKFIQLTALARGMPESALEQYKGMMIGDLVNGPRSKWATEWAARQCYIALGNLMTSAAMMGIDTCPMEGIDPAAYDKLLNLGSTGYQTVVACAVGMRSSTDAYAHAKKVRYPAGEVMITK